MEAIIKKISASNYPAYKESGERWFGEIPAHWKIQRIKSIVESECNGVWGKDPGQECSTFCIRVADFDRDRLKVSTEKLTLREIIKVLEKI